MSFPAPLSRAVPCPATLICSPSTAVGNERAHDLASCRCCRHAWAGSAPSSCQGGRPSAPLPSCAPHYIFCVASFAGAPPCPRPSRSARRARRGRLVPLEHAHGRTASASPRLNVIPVSPLSRFPCVGGCCATALPRRHGSCSDARAANFTAACPRSRRPWPGAHGTLGLGRWPSLYLRRAGKPRCCCSCRRCCCLQDPPPIACV